MADSEGLRPTSERIRETLFNWLTNDVAGSHCLDLYAGTGVLGFEALSRGAASATLIEKSAAVVRGLEEAARQLGADDATVLRGDALDFLASEPAERYDLVFVDPPFAANLVAETLRLLHSKHWLAAHAMVYVEQDVQQPLPELPSGWVVSREKTAGNVCYRLLSASSQDNNE